MENKTTTELLNLLQSLVDEDGKTKEGYEEAYAELRKREPFESILESEYQTGESLEEKVAELEADVKELKRHKHDEKNGDVLIRI